MAFLHKLIEGGEQWLPFAMSRLRALRPLFEGKHASQTFSMSDGAEVKVAIAGEQEYIRIAGASPEYEFFASEHISDETLTSSGSTFGVSGSAVRGSSVKKVEPIFSSALTPAKPEDWGVQSLEAPQTPGDPKITWRSWASWQSAKFFEYPHWSDSSGKSLTTSTIAQAPGWNSQCGWMSSRMATRLANVGILTADFGRDVLPAHYSNGNVLVGAPDFPQAWVWWRRATVQSAIGRKFVICTDNVGRFHVYPAKNYPPPYLLTPDKFKTFTPPYPTWVTVPDPENYVNQINHWLWAFDKEGKRAVSCPYHSVASDFYKHLIKRSAAILPEQVSLLGEAPGSVVRGREDIPGLVEFGIEISQTGPDEMDFDVTFTLLRNSYSLESGRFIFEAAYALKDKGKSKVGVAEDTLVTAELECFTAGSDYTPGPSTADRVPYPYFEHSVKHMQAKLVINANGDNLEPTELRRAHAWGPVSVRFLTTEGFRQMTTPGGTGYISEYIPVEGGDLTLADNSSRFFHANSAVNYTGSVEQPEAGQKLGFIFALELRTLSLTYHSQNIATGAGRAELIHYNELVKGVDFSLGYTGASEAPVADVKVPTAATPVYMYALTRCLNTEWGQGFSVHPAGHWAHCVNAELGKTAGTPEFYDIVQPRNGKRTTHKALFNKAFKQSREYSFYQTNFAGRINWDYGSFRTAGIWTTF